MGAGGRWYAAALLLPASLFLSAHVVSYVLLPSMSPGRTPDSPRASSAELLMLATVSLAANPWEEVGWRAFAITIVSAIQSQLRDFWLAY